jgi:hypothetical protein
MNKTLTTIMAIMLSLLLVCSAFAAEKAEKGITGAGITAGLNLGKVTGDDTKETIAGKTYSPKMILGFAGGAFVEYSFSPMFAVQPEALIVMGGAKYDKITEGGVTVTPKLTLTYIQIPVLFKVKPTMTGKIKPNVFAGPFLGILMSAKAKGQSTTGVDASVDVKSYYKSTNFGVAFGVGAAYPMTKGAITLDARYSLGLSKIGKSVTVLGTSYTPKIKTADISIMLGYNFL